MRHLTKIPPFDSFLKLEFQVFSFSKFSRRKPPSKPQKQPALRKNDTDSLFNEITEILGSGNLGFDKNPDVGSVYNVSMLMGLESKGCCTPSVCENAGEKNEDTVMRDAQMGSDSVNGNDVSEVVHKITQIVRGGDAGVFVEERLDGSSGEISSEVVCMVLKRCFKVPHLGGRFFNWVKLNKENCVTTESYNTMLYLAGEAKEFEMVERLVEEMENSPCGKDIKTWGILLLHYGKAKLVGKALITFERMKRSGFEPDVEAYRLMIRLLCESRKGEIALEFYKEMVRKDMGLDIKLYRLLLNCLAGCGDINGVYLVAENMIKISEIPDHNVYHCVLTSFCMSERIREALELIRDLKNKNLTMSPVYFETLVKGLCKANKMDDALEIVDIMKKRNVVNEVVYGALINGYLRKKDALKALDLFHAMKVAGFTPLTSTYTELMQHLFSVNEYEKGSSLFHEMLEKGVKLDSVAYIAMVAGHVRHDNISDAWKLFESMEGQGISPMQKSFLIFIKELCRSSKTDEVIKVLRKMQDSKINIGKEISHCVISYVERKREVMEPEAVEEIQRHCGYHCREMHNIRDSNNVESNVESNHLESNVNCLLLEPLPRAFNNEDLQTVCKILSSSKNWSLMQEALEKCDIHYTPDLVFETLRICGPFGCAVLNFFSWVRKQPGYRHTVETYNMAIKIAGRGKDFKYMRTLFYEMQRNGFLVTSDTWTIMIMSYGRVGLTDIALRHFSEMSESGFKPTGSTYKYLILSLCGRKGGNVEEAQKLFKEMINTGLVPDKELVEGFFNCLCTTGKLVDAKKCLEDLREVGFTNVICCSLLIRALCRRGNVDEALSVAENFEDRSTLEHYIYGSLVHGLLKNGQTDEALAKLDSMKRVGVNPTVHVYTSLISHFCKEKKIDKALDIFKQMWEDGCCPTVFTYTALLNGYMRIGKVNEAQKIFLRMRLKGPFPDFKAYTVLMAGLCEMGKSEEALEVLSDMVDDGVVPSSVNFRTVFFGLNREGKRDLAQTVLQKKRAIANRRKLLHG